jgi:predicted aspartyl protease
MKTFIADGESYSTSLQKALVKLRRTEMATFTLVQNSRPLTGTFLTSVYTIHVHSLK